MNGLRECPEVIRPVGGVGHERPGQDRFERDGQLRVHLRGAAHAGPDDLAGDHLV